MPANFSNWVDVRVANLATLKKGEERVAWEDVIPEQQNTSFSVRLEVYTVSVTQAMMYVTMVPMSITELTEICDKWEEDINSDKVPVVLLQWGTSDSDKKKGGVEVALMVRERASDKCGMGIYPLIEQV